MTHDSPPALATLQPLAGDIDLASFAESDVRSLYDASQGDGDRFRRYLKRLRWGDPLPYILGQLTFRGHTIKLDRRAYITDPELTHLIDYVLADIDVFWQHHGRSPLVAEFGIGCGSLALALKRERPGLFLVGVDIDGGAIALAQENIAQAKVDIPLIESDFFTSWPYPHPPDIIYGDPPWGETTDLYDEERSAAYYHAMPCMSAYPVGGKAAVHDGLLRHLAQNDWPSLLLLNGGVLPAPILDDLQALMHTCTILHPTPHLSILRGTVAA
jgi:hypothetical protein